MRTDATGRTVTTDRASDLSSVHLELHGVLLGAQSLPQVLDRVAHLATTAVPDIDEASVTVVEGGRARTVVFTGELAVQLDERQYEAGFGPCLDAATLGRLVQVPDTSTDSAYPEFASQAHRSGVSRTLSVGLPLREGTAAALNLCALSGRGPRRTRPSTSCAGCRGRATASSGTWRRRSSPATARRCRTTRADPPLSFASVAAPPTHSLSAAPNLCGDAPSHLGGRRQGPHRPVEGTAARSGVVPGPGSRCAATTPTSRGDPRIK